MFDYAITANPDMVGHSSAIASCILERNVNLSPECDDGRASNVVEKYEASASYMKNIICSGMYLEKI